MDHGYIERQNLVERYALGRLDEKESIRFEEHFADCLECQDQVEAAQDLAAGLATFSETADEKTGNATDNIVPFSSAATEAHATVRPRPSTWWPVAAALLVLPSLWLMWQNAPLSEQLRELRRPFASTPTLSFEATRTSTNSATEVPMIDISTAGPWITLGFALGDVGTFELSARLEGPGGTELWRGQNLRRSTTGEFQIILPRAILDPGAYLVRFEVLSPDGRSQDAGDFRFEVAPAGKTPEEL